VIAIYSVNDTALQVEWFLFSFGPTFFGKRADSSCLFGK